MLKIQILVSTQSEMSKLQITLSGELVNMGRKLANSDIYFRIELNLWLFTKTLEARDGLQLHLEIPSSGFLPKRQPISISHNLSARPNSCLNRGTELEGFQRKTMTMIKPVKTLVQGTAI